MMALLGGTIMGMLLSAPHVLSVFVLTLSQEEIQQGQVDENHSRRYHWHKGGER